MPKSVVAAFLMVMVFAFASATAMAQSVTTVQALSFGEWMNFNNDAQHEVTVNTDGSYSADAAGFVVITPPQQGIYDIEDGFTPGTPVVSVVITQNTPMTRDGLSYTVDAFQETHSAVVDANGVVRVTVGATANTSGNSVFYADGTYSGSIDITINF